MSRESILKRKSFEFAVKIVNLYKFLKTHHKEYALFQQLLRSGTAIGALVSEAEHAESRKDFAHKLALSLKEANETIYWLRLLSETGFIVKEIFDSMLLDSTELLKMLIASIRTTKNGDRDLQKIGI